MASTDFFDPWRVNPNIHKLTPEQLRTKIKNIIRPNYNDEWLDESKHFKEAAHEVMRLLLDHAKVRLNG